VSTPLLVDYYNKLPQRQANEPPREAKARWQAALEKFKKRVGERYNEGTLVRLLETGDSRTRQAALTALGLLGTMDANASVASMLSDEDAEVRQLAADTLWSLWFRAEGEENGQELQRLVRLRDREKALAGFDQLILRAPGFAEAYNQRAVLAFRMKQYERSIADCEKVLQLNPYHFGAQAGIAQCYLQLRKHKAALKAFRNTLRLNPHMEGVAETIRALENALGEEGRKDDKK
jgi:tetratricopeptide (TPR) repeat protein